jgi:hypothetical protein
VLQNNYVVYVVQVDQSHHFLQLNCHVGLYSLYSTPSYIPSLLTLKGMCFVMIKNQYRWENLWYMAITIFCNDISIVYLHIAPYITDFPIYIGFWSWQNTCPSTLTTKGYMMVYCIDCINQHDNLIVEKYKYKDLIYINIIYYMLMI